MKEKNEKSILNLLSIIAIIYFILMSVLAYRCGSVTVKYDSLKQSTYTYNYDEIIENELHIYVLELDEPLVIQSQKRKYIDFSVVNKLKYGTKLDCYTMDTNEIMELSNDNNYIIKLSDCNKLRKSIYYVLIICLSSMFLIISIILLLKLKFVKKNFVSNKALSYYFENSNLDQKEIESIVKKLNELDDYKPKYNKKQLKEQIKNSLIKKDNKYFIKAIELMKEPLYFDCLNEYLFETMEDEELRVLYDEDLLDECQINIVYKCKKHLINTYIFKENADSKYQIDFTNLVCDYPSYKKLSKKEIKSFVNAIINFNEKNDNMLTLDDKILNNFYKLY